MIIFLLYGIGAGIITNIVLNFFNAKLNFRKKIYNKINDIILTRVILTFTLTVIFVVVINYAYSFNNILLGVGIAALSFFLKN